jgi:hypothetical protein
VQDNGKLHGHIDERFVPEGFDELAFEALSARQRGDPPAAIAQVLLEEHHLDVINVHKLLRAIGLSNEDAQGATNEAIRRPNDP